MTIAFTALSGSRFCSRHVLLSGPKLQNTNCTNTFSTAVTVNNTIVECFFQIHASAYHQSDILNFLPWNSHLTPLRPKDGQFVKYCRTPLNYRSQLQSGTKVVDTLVWNGCFYKTFNSFIISFLLNAVNPLTTRINVVWSKRRTWGSKMQHWFWGEGVGLDRGRG